MVNPAPRVAREDVVISYHQGSESLPMVNVKSYRGWRELVDDDFYDAIADTVGEDHPIMRDGVKMAREEIMTWGERCSTRGEWWWEELAREFAWEELQDQARETFGALGYTVKVWSEGRSGGWAVVEGLPSFERDPDGAGWDDDDHADDPWREDGELLAAWSEFVRDCRIAVDGYPCATLYAFVQGAADDIAGMTRTVTVHVKLHPDQNPDFLDAARERIEAVLADFPGEVDITEREG